MPAWALSRRRIGVPWKRPPLQFVSKVAEEADLEQWLPNLCFLAKEVRCQSLDVALNDILVEVLEPIPIICLKTLCAELFSILKYR
jgi:hypothetical protein